MQRLLFRLFAFAAAGVSTTAMAAQVLLKEPTTLRIGERVFIDDGVCPTGQIREVVGVSSKGPEPARVERKSQCVSRRFNR
jgi:hypothetical protein